MKRKRVQIDLSEQMLIRVDALVEQIDATSQAEVIRRAVRLFDTVIQEHRKGRKLLIRDENGADHEVIITL